MFGTILNLTVLNFYLNIKNIYEYIRVIIKTNLNIINKNIKYIVN